MYKECIIKFKLTESKAISIQIKVTIRFLRFNIMPSKDKVNSNKLHINNLSSICFFFSKKYLGNTFKTINGEI